MKRYSIVPMVLLAVTLLASLALAAFDDAPEGGASAARSFNNLPAL